MTTEAPTVTGKPWSRGRLCSIVGCNRKHFGKGYCNSHHSEFVRRRPTKPAICSACRREFTAKLSSYGWRKTCSRECAHNARLKPDAGIAAIHKWVKRRLQKPDLCIRCKMIPPVDMANISQKYLRDLTDWEYLCRRCHMVSDGRLDNFMKNCRSPPKR